MPVNISRPVGRPSFTEVALFEWAVLVAEALEADQEAKDFVSSGDSVAGWYVTAAKKNRIYIGNRESYTKYSVDGRGRGPGFVSWKIILDWMDEKNIGPRKETERRTMAWFISKKITKEGNAVYRKKREGISVKEIIEDSWRDNSPALGLATARGAADAMVKGFNKLPNLKVK